jgi:hypothetical protein
VTNAPVFIVGAPRSGTSLLRDLLRSHPHLAFSYETHFLPKFFRAYGDPRSDREAHRLAARILGLAWMRLWEPELEPASLAHHRSYAGLVSAIYEEMARRAGKQRWGDKTPQYVVEIPTLLRIFPRAKILHIYRDGRDVALSVARARFGPHNLYMVATAWRAFVETGRREGRRLPPGAYAEVRYENLLNRPEETMRRVCAFLGEPFGEEVLRRSFLPRKPRRSLFGRPDQPPPPSPTVIVRSNLGKWKSAMRPADRSLFESVAGDVLAELGYEVEGVDRPIPGRERITWNVHHYFRGLVYRLTTGQPSPTTFLLMREAEIRQRLRRSAARSIAESPVGSLAE